MADTAEKNGQSALWNMATPWTALLNSSAMKSAGLERLLTIYRDPVYAYFRAQQLNSADAEDLTQQLLMDFFLVRGSHRAADPARGRFRNFLLSSARNALLDWKKRGRSLKRGGKVAHVHLDALLAGPVPELKVNKGVDPDGYFDRYWALATWRTAYDLFRNRVSRQLVEAFELCYASSGKGSQEQSARKLGISIAAYNSRTFMARKRFYECIKEVVRATLDDPDEIKVELEYLFQLLTEHGFR